MAVGDFPNRGCEKDYSGAGGYCDNGRCCEKGHSGAGGNCYNGRCYEKEYSAAGGYSYNGPSGRLHLSLDEKV